MRQILSLLRDRESPNESFILHTPWLWHMILLKNHPFPFTVWMNKFRASWKENVAQMRRILYFSYTCRLLIGYDHAGWDSLGIPMLYFKILVIRIRSAGGEWGTSSSNLNTMSRRLVGHYIAQNSLVANMKLGIKPKGFILVCRALHQPYSYLCPSTGK